MAILQTWRGGDEFQNTGGVPTFMVTCVIGPDYFKVTDTGGLNVNVSRGWGSSVLSVSPFLVPFGIGKSNPPVALEGLDLEDLPANQTFYLYIAMDEESPFVGNHPWRRSKIKLVARTEPEYDGALKLARITTDADSITALEDMRVYAFHNKVGARNVGGWPPQAFMDLRRVQPLYGDNIQNFHGERTSPLTITVESPPELVPNSGDKSPISFAMYNQCGQPIFIVTAGENPAREILRNGTTENFIYDGITLTRLATAAETSTRAAWLYE